MYILLNYTNNNSGTGGIYDLSDSINNMGYMLGNVTQMFYNISDSLTKIDIADIKINYGIIIIVLLVYIFMLIIAVVLYNRHHIYNKFSNKIHANIENDI
jgi:hypothetical protein|tara:strand:- start:1245 stop:1544 length:300 start_codon:yes stop_codon:yes gene_type:complete